MTEITVIREKSFDEERALYNLTDAKLYNCEFSGPADGESALKESRNVYVEGTRFALRYPLWHVKGWSMQDCTMEITARAPIWYAEKGSIVNSRLECVKPLRECKKITVKNSVINAPETGWKCSDMNFTGSEINSEYFLLDSRKIVLDNVRMTGKYSFQYVQNATITDSKLDTKDAFWHSKNVTVRNSLVKGEYLGWYSENLTLIDCTISGTQPLCYAKNLTLINCVMENADLAFEYSSVNAELRGHIDSVKNPLSGSITADSIGEIILENSIAESSCKITQKKRK